MIRTGARAATLALLVALSCALAGCTSIGAVVCPPGAKATRIGQLYFGRNIGEQLGVSDADFRDFLDHEVAPRFASGFTVEDGHGFWRAPSGAMIEEPSKILTVVFSGRPGEASRLSEVAAAYKLRFHQDSVLLVSSPACAAF